MKVTIVYESMFGNTRLVANAIASGVGIHAQVDVRSVNQLVTQPLGVTDLLIVGAPTHVHSLSRPATRAEAERQAHESLGHLVFEPDGARIGVREWLAALQPHSTNFAAFDTRADIPRPLSGAASGNIDRALTALGFAQLAPPESFLVHGSDLHTGELDRARAWGERLHSLMQAQQLA